MTTNYEDDELCEGCDLPWHECECAPAAATDPEQARYIAEHEAAERAEREREGAEREEQRAEEREAFGRTCKRVQDLLVVHKLPHTFQDAKPWVRLFDGDSDVTDTVAAWLDAGWTNADAVDPAALRGLDPQEATRAVVEMGASVEQIMRDGGWVIDGQREYLGELFEAHSMRVDNTRTPQST